MKGFRPDPDPASDPNEESDDVQFTYGQLMTTTGPVAFITLPNLVRFLHEVRDNIDPDILATDVLKDLAFNFSKIQ